MTDLGATPPRVSPANPPAERGPFGLDKPLFDRLLVAAIILVLAAWIIPNINWRLVDRYWFRYLEGIAVTFQLVLISVGLGAALSLPLALARLSKRRWLTGIARGYITFFRGTPLLAQLFLLYYGVGQFNDAFEAIGLWWFFREPLYVAILTFTLNTAAYQAEIMRGAIGSLPKGQEEAAMALGMSRWPIFFKVILPQAYIVALRPLGNELILMIKGSAIASIVTVLDLMGITSLAYARSFNFQAFFWAAALYLIAVEAVRRLWDVLERRLTRHLALSH
ncbi:MAG: ABC transporter permease subunit [Devosiaceae bacterium]|nr:ABC transporter permease subunit [Devosiaceae bacterium MH13]